MKLNIKFTEVARSFRATFKITPHTFKARFKGLQPITTYIGGEPYTGDYVITPKVNEQTMKTKDKVMTDNVTIKSIPFFNVSNNSGGSTVYIGDEV